MNTMDSQRSLRTNVYFADGQGRDSYIFGSNGGFFKCTDKFSIEGRNYFSPSPSNRVKFSPK